MNEKKRRSGDDEIFRAGSIKFIQREMKLFRLSLGRSFD